MADDAKTGEGGRKGFEKVRRVFQVNDINNQVSTYLITLSRQGWVDPATGVKHDGLYRDIQLNKAFQYVLAADAPLYEEQLGALRTVAAKYGNITELGADKENIPPVHLRDQVDRSRVRMEGERSKVENSVIGLAQAEKEKMTVELDELRKQNAMLLEQNAQNSARLKILEAKR